MRPEESGRGRQECLRHSITAGQEGFESSPDCKTRFGIRQH
jgi:hypothetical protein